jgi:ABC-type sugar transport system permease subunit
VILFCVFLLYPLGRSVALSLTKTAGPRSSEFVGLGHYRFLLTDQFFWLAVGNTVLYAVAIVGLQVPLSLGLAMLLNSRFVRFRGAFRFAFFSTYLVGYVVVAILFRLLLAPRQGLVNRVIGLVLPAVGSETAWNADWRFAYPAIVLAGLWLTAGYGMVYFLAALQAVDRELYEAAEVDGAGPWARFRHVTLPGIRPVMVFLVLAGTIAALQLFELPYVFFQGVGPQHAGLTAVVFLYHYGFQTGDIGYTSAIGWTVALLILGVALFQIRASGAARDDG